MIAIIPARGGSKGVPGKNIKPIEGKPLIAYTIEAALGAKGIERVIVTTDDEDIAKVAKDAGAEVPFLRPAELATDTAAAPDVYMHAVEFLSKDMGVEIENFMVLLPTAPLRTSQHIDEAIDLFNKTSARTLLSFKEADTPVTWYNCVDENGRVHNAGFGAGDAMKNRQTNETYLIPNGAIYILSYSLLKESRTYFCDNTVPYVMSAEDSIDIDYPIDFEIASLMVKKRNEANK